MFNVLIADDEELERRAIKNIISNNFGEAFHIYEARNGREAIEIADRIIPDLVITDIKMPGINGIEAIKEMHRRLKDTYFIIVTAYDYFNYAKEAIDNNVKQYILKPFKREDLTNKISIALGYLEQSKSKRHMELELKEKLYSVEPLVKDELCSSIIQRRLGLIDYKRLQQTINIDLNEAYALSIKIIEEKSLRLNVIIEHIEKLSMDYWQFITYILSEHKIIIFSKLPEEEKDYLTLAKAIRRMLRDKFSLNSYIGIGWAVSNIFELTKSYEQAEEALKHCAEKNKIIYYESTLESQPLEEGHEAYKDENNENMINKALRYINNNYNMDITLEAVAREVNMSAFHFSKSFKEMTGINFIDYLTEYRIKIAKEKLKEGIYSIKEICFQIGYSDPNYFSRVFKKIEGISPSEYKNNLFNL